MATNFPDLFAHLDRILRLPSISSANTRIDMSNLVVIEYLAECFTDLGFSCEIVESPSSSQLKKANLIATFGTGPGGLVLAGHTDTVPMDEALWKVPPLQLTQKDNRLYGLGSADMKGFFPIIMEAVKTMGELKLNQPLIVLATADEETSMQGARTLAALGKPKARYAVIGEPTGLRPVRAHKGIMMETLRLQGQSGHSSDPSLGKNALEAMHSVIGELLEFRKDIQARFQDDLFSIAHPTLNLGCIHGGDNPNRICGHCELEFDIRLMPGMEMQAMRDDISQRMRPIAERFGVEFSLTPLFPGIPAFFTPADSSLVHTAEQLTRHNATTVAFGTEGPMLQELGMETIVLGPGDIDQAHQPDEYLALSRIKPCIELLQSLITRFCIQPDNTVVPAGKNVS